MQQVTLEVDRNEPESTVVVGNLQLPVELVVTLEIEDLANQDASIHQPVGVPHFQGLLMRKPVPKMLQFEQQVLEPRSPQSEDALG